MSGRISPSLSKSPSSPSGAPGHAPSRSSFLSSSFLADRLQADVTSLDDLERAWRPLALRGNAKAADRVLAIHRQRAAVLQLALQAAAQAEQHEVAAKAATADRKIIVEYVDDWRKVREEGAIPLEFRRSPSGPAPEQGASQP